MIPSTVVAIYLSSLQPTKAAGVLYKRICLASVDTN